MNYVLITPVKDEQKFIQQTIDSVVNQTALPLVWVIIDGGSTDKTRDIIQENAKKYPWIVLRFQSQFGTTSHMNVSIAMKEAYEYIQKSGIPFDYVANIDADQVMPNDFFEGIITEMDKDRNIAVASGQAHNPDGKPDTYPSGELNNKRIYRRSAFEHIGGYPVTKYSFDTVILAKIRMMDEQIISYPEYKIQNLRKDMGIEHTSKIKSNIMWGKSKWYLGYSFPLLVAGCGYLLTKGEVSKSIGVFFGWMDSWINHDEIIADKEVWNHFHNERLSQVLDTVWIEPRISFIIFILVMMFVGIVLAWRAFFAPVG